MKSDTTEEDMADIPGVTPLAGVWVEIISTSRQLQSSQVTPLAGVWVEITGDSQYTEGSRSLPLRECGLKFPLSSTTVIFPKSLPLRECGLKSEIEIPEGRGSLPVTPLAGVWVEMLCFGFLSFGKLTSLPLRECGLK